MGKETQMSHDDRVFVSSFVICHLCLFECACVFLCVFMSLRVLCVCVCVFVFAPARPHTCVRVRMCWRTCVRMCIHVVFVCVRHI